MTPGGRRGGREGGGREEGHGEGREQRVSIYFPQTLLSATFSEYLIPSLIRSTSTSLDSISAFITCPLGKIKGGYTCR